MGDSIKYAVSVSPLEEIADEQANTYTVISGEVGRNLSGSGVAVVTNYGGTAAAQGYLNATVNYLECIDSTDATDISSETTASFVLIKNTGYTFSDATTLGATLAKSVKVMSGTTLLSLLDSGEVYVAKDDNAGIDCTELHVRTVDVDGSNNAAAGHLAVEYLVVD